MAENKCEICNMALKSEAELMDHNQKIHGQAPKICKACGAAFKSDKALMDHSATAHKM